MEAREDRWDSLMSVERANKTGYAAFSGHFDPVLWRGREGPERPAAVLLQAALVGEALHRGDDSADDLRRVYAQGLDRRDAGLGEGGGSVKTKLKIKTKF